MKKYQPDGQHLIMTRGQVRAFDALAINELGVPGVVLMENAGRSCAELIVEKLSGVTNPRICIFCGTGNNGGDGFVIARHLLNRRFNVIVVVCGDRGRIKGDARTNLDILEELGGRIEQLDITGIDSIKDCVPAYAGNADMVVDAIFGTGLMGQLSEEFKQLIKSINALASPILSVDIPSGIDCDTGQPLGTAIKATWTVTFVAFKKGFAVESAQAHTGEIFVASIGVEPKYI